MATDETSKTHDGADNVTAVNDLEQLEPTNDLEKPQLERPSENLQRGVQDIEALTLSWSKTALIIIFAK